VLFLRRLGLVLTGVFAGFMGAAALARRIFVSQGDAESDEVALVAIFDGIELKSRAGAFRGGSMVSWYGGIAVDLREAQLAPDARLRLHSLFGGIAIRVPTGWKVESTMNAVGGGVAVQVPPPDEPDAPTLTLEGFTVFGGIAVGAKPGEPGSDE